jgi:5-methylcytosine-specific restriction endonuclease McrA
MANTANQIECANPRCDNLFTPKCAQHGFCCEKCRRAARGSQWRKFRNAALRRDSFTCQDCQARECRLEVHHCQPLTKGGSNSLHNLLTLCVKCHRLRHRSWKLGRAWEVKDATIRPPKGHSLNRAA